MHTLQCPFPATHTHEHKQSFFSAIYHIWVYSTLAMSIYSRVHLGEPKLIEAHHNGLFISYWTDRPTPSLSCTVSLSSSLSAVDMNRKIESGWCTAVSSWLWGPQGHFCVFKMDTESSLFSPTGWCFCLTPTHVALSHIHTDQHKPWYTFMLIKLALFRFILNLKFALFSPTFFSFSY